MAAVQVTAWAKINLYLHVLGRRPDGYHLLESLVVFAGIGDLLRFEAAPDFSLTIDGPFADALDGDKDNLVAQAAHDLAGHFGKRPGARITLEKQLPVAAGLGGGSADAAASLLGLARLWQLPTELSQLEGLAASLGADVPVCLSSQPSIMSGIGERLHPVEALPQAWVVLVNPGMPLSTPKVFGMRRGPFSEPARPFEKQTDAAALASYLASCRNDLEPTARRLLPVIDTVLSSLRHSQGCLIARLSGSGGSCFGLYQVHQDALSAAEAISASQPRWWVKAAPLLTAAEVTDRCRGPAEEIPAQT